MRDRSVKDRKYVVVQRTGFVPYFLCAWNDGTESWGVARTSACLFDVRVARRIANKLNARRPGALLPVVIEVAAR